MVRMDFHRRSGGGGKPPSTAGRLGLSLFLLLFFALGSVFEVVTVREFGRTLGRRSWRKTPCTILVSKVQEGGGESPYAFTVGYQYDYGGQSRTGSVYKRNYSGSRTYSGTQELVQRYPAGRATVCYVNPKNPAEAVLKRDSLLIGLAALFPLIFVVIGAGGLYFIWRKSPLAEAKPIAALATGARGKSRYIVTAFFALFAIAGGAMLYPLSIKPIARTIDAQSWASTPCKVLRAEVRSHAGDDGTTYSVYILYQYEFGGQTHKSDRYDFVGGSSSGYKGKARIVAQYESAPDLICYVNPDNPSEAVLKRGFHAKLLLALFPLPFLLVGLAGAVYTIRSGKGGSSLSATQDTRRRVPTCECLSILRPGDAGPVVLKPKFSTPMKLVGAILIAAFWNGIVWTLLFHVELFAKIFLLPFAAMGIGLNDDRSAFAPGEQVEGRIEWGLDLNPTALELSLLWYTSGKGTRDVRVWDRHRVDHPGSFGSEKFSLMLPPGPYSFSGRLISLIWALELTCMPGSETVCKEIVVSPTGREIVLTSVASPADGQSVPDKQLLERILGRSHASSR